MTSSRSTRTVWTLSVILGFSVATAHGQPMLELVEDRGHYLLMNDADGLFETTPPRDWREFQPLLRAIERGYRAVHLDNSRILITFTIPPVDRFGYHRPLANSVHGIGHAHWDTPPLRTINGPGYYDNEGIWDGTPDSSLQGIAYLGNFQRYLDPDGIGGFNTENLQSLLSHEVGHSWLAFPWYRGDGGEIRKDLLDWEETHWSVYVDSGGSSPGAPARSLLGGHDWRQLEPGRFMTPWIPEAFQGGFGDLDLYLMGVLPAEEVSPLLVIEDPDRCFWNGVSIDCAPEDDANLSPPFLPGEVFNPDTTGEYVVEGKGRMVSIEDIIAFEGSRRPSFGEAPAELPVTFMVIKRPETTVSEENKLVLEAMVQRSIEIWSEMTRGLFPMVNRSSLDDATTGVGPFTCIEDSNTLCLAGGRFQARIQWRTGEGDTGLGTVVNFGTDDSGIFWFFDQDNWEVMVKVLDPCSFTDHFWVFAGALTNVEYTLTVTDTTTGENKRYRNPLGQRSAAVADTSAFRCR